jgi:hypothetical protein
MHPDLMWQAALERCADQLRAAERAHRARRTVEPEHPVAAPEVTLRGDRVRDSLRLHELARLAGRPLPGGSFVVGEIGGRIVAALPLGRWAAAHGSRRLGRPRAPAARAARPSDSTRCHPTRRGPALAAAPRVETDGKVSGTPCVVRTSDREHLRLPM